MKRCLSCLLLLLWTPAWADDAGLLRCRGLTDAAMRLACYDALPAGAAPVSASPAPAALAPTVAAKVAQFGVLRQADEIESIDSSLPGRFEGWRPGSMLRLANGQIWQIMDDSSAFAQLDNPKATVRRGALGAFYLNVVGITRSPRVRRVN